MKIIHRFQVYRSNFVRKSGFGEKWAFLNQCTSVTLYISIQKSAMRPTFQNIDCFKDKIASITGILAFSTVNPENFSLIPLYHPKNKANFWSPNTLKRAMFTPNFHKEGKMQAVFTREAWHWPCWFSFMCHSQLTMILNSNFHGKI